MAVFRLFLTLLLFQSLFTLCAEERSKRVDVVAYATNLPYINEPFYNPKRLESLKNKYLITYERGFERYIQSHEPHNPAVHKVILLDLSIYQGSFLGYHKSKKNKKIPKEKAVFFKIEPVDVFPEFYNNFSKVYTFEDNLVDGKKFFKFYYPVLKPMLKEYQIPAFRDKKLCIIIAKHWNHERVAICDFFAKKPNDALHIYGYVHRRVPRFEKHPMYKGAIEGWPTGKAKIDTLKKYRFCICFENTHTMPGYISEKIFDVFAGGCVPIYWGSDNIEKHIPKECFINYTDFKSHEELYAYLTKMSESDYKVYLQNIRKFLSSDKAKLFSQEHYDKTITEAIR